MRQLLQSETLAVSGGGLLDPAQRVLHAFAEPLKQVPASRSLPGTPIPLPHPLGPGHGDDGGSGGGSGEGGGGGGGGLGHSICDFGACHPN